MLDQPSELTINATAFKARCLGLMDDLARGRIKRVVVTKRGKPVSVMTTADVAQEKPVFVDDGKYPSYWGCMKIPGLELTEDDWVEIEREIKTIHDPIDLEAMDRDFAEQLRR